MSLAPLALALVVGATAPPVSKATALAAAQNWEELYLTFAAAPVASYSAPDKKKLADTLTKGCAALETSDPAMAMGLAEKAVELEPLADALLCVGRVGPHVEQASAAEAALKKGLAKFPNDGRFGLTLGKQLVAENDAQGALAALEKVPKKSPEAGEAETLKQKAKGLAQEGASARAQADRDARAAARAEVESGSAKPPPQRRGGKQIVVEEGEGGPQPRGAPPPNGLGNGYESSVDAEGRRIRANQHFRFRYFNGQRDFGQRAEYEGRVQAALEQAREGGLAVLGETRESPTDVILYSKEEFIMHHGAAMARAVAGFYSENAIRMNDSAEINAQNQAVLVHEYTHAVIDEACSFKTHQLPIWVNEGLAEWVEWRFQKQDGPPAGQAANMKALAKAGGLPKLKSLEHQTLVETSNPALAYATSACAIRVLVKKRNEGEVMSMIRDIGKGMPWPVSLEKHFGLTPDRLQEELESDLK